MNATPPTIAAVRREYMALLPLKVRIGTTVEHAEQIKAQLAVISASGCGKPMGEDQIRGHGFPESAVAYALDAHRWLTAGGETPSAGWERVLQ